MALTRKQTIIGAVTAGVLVVGGVGYAALNSGGDSKGAPQMAGGRPGGPGSGPGGSGGGPGGPGAGRGGR